MPKFIVKEMPIRHNGTVYSVGKEIELDEKESGRLEEFLETAEASVPAGIVIPPEPIEPEGPTEPESAPEPTEPEGTTESAKKSTKTTRGGSK